MKVQLKQPNKARRHRKVKAPAVSSPRVPQDQEAAVVSDGLALVIFQQLKTRSIVDVVRVYDELQRRFPLESHDDHTQWCVDALGACVEAKGKASLPVYREFWSSLPDRSVWPSPDVIRRTFGTWTSARARVEAVPQAHGFAGGLRKQPEFSAAGIEETLRVWLDELGDDGLAGRLRCEAFLEWCRSRLGDPSYAGLALPVNPKTVRKYVGSWRKALERVGAYQRAAHLRTMRSRPYDALSDDELLDVFVEAIELWDEVPSYSEYCREQRNGTKTLPNRPLPPGQIILSRLGGWNAALISGGLLTAEEAARRTCSRREKITTTFALEMLRRAAEELGPEMVRAAYRRWRVGHIECHGKDSATPPSDAWICNHFDSWDRAMLLALSSRGVGVQEVAA